jgi:hypothetical protein
MPIKTGIEERLTLYFIKPDITEELKHFKKLIRSYVKQSSDRGGFVSYRNVPSALTGAEMVLENAVEQVTDGHVLRGIKISV